MNKSFSSNIVLPIAVLYETEFIFTFQNLRQHNKQKKRYHISSDLISRSKALKHSLQSLIQRQEQSTEYQQQHTELKNC